jgi:hypothetical protein
VNTVRVVLVLALVAALAFAGCADLAGDGDASDDVDPSRNEDPGADRGNETDGRDDGNRTDPGDDDGDQGGNETDESDGSEGNGTDDGSQGRGGWGDPADAPVRPGAQVLDGSCTAHFVFTSPDNATVYVGTAAHCLGDAGVGDRVSLAGGEATGVVAYDSFATMDRVDESSNAARRFNDFALVAVDPGFRGKVHPAARTYGGPTDRASSASVGDRVLTYGASNTRPGVDELDDREGLVVGSSDWHVDLYLAGPGVPGDSGSPVLTEDGRALGVLVTLEFTPGPGSNDATKVQRAVEYMENHGGPDVELATWSQFSDGRLPG